MERKSKEIEGNREEIGKLLHAEQRVSNRDEKKISDRGAKLNIRTHTEDFIFFGMRL